MIKAEALLFVDERAIEAFRMSVERYGPITLVFQLHEDGMTTRIIDEAGQELDNDAEIGDAILAAARKWDNG
jgi:hypothetical protein